LSEQEIQTFKEQIMNAAGNDGKLSKKEANAYLQNLGVEGKADNLYGFLNGVGETSKNITSSTTDTKTNTQTTNYNDGTTVTVDKNGNITTTKDGKSVTTDRNGNKLSEEEQAQNADGENYTVRTEFDQNGNKTREIRTVSGGSQVINYDTSGKPVSMEVSQNADNSVELYDYDADGNVILKERTENSGKQNEAMTEFTYNTDGNLSQTTTLVKGNENPVITEYEYGTTQVMGSDAQVVTQISGRGSADEVIGIETTVPELGTRRVETKNKNGTEAVEYVMVTDENGNQSEVIQSQVIKDANGNIISTAQRKDDNTYLSQTFMPDGKGHLDTCANAQGVLQYQKYTDASGKPVATAVYTQDGKGTFDYVQLHENLDTIAMRYGLAKQDLLDANPGFSEKDFKPGQKFVIPGLVSAADMVGRKDTSGIDRQSRQEYSAAAREHNVDFLVQETSLDPKTYAGQNGRVVSLKVPVEMGTRQTETGSGGVADTYFVRSENANFRVVGKVQGGDYYVVSRRVGNKVTYHYANKELTEIEYSMTPEQMKGAIYFKNKHENGNQIRVVQFETEDGYTGANEAVALVGQDSYGNKTGYNPRGRLIVIDKVTGMACYADGVKAQTLHAKNELEQHPKEAAKQMTAALRQEIAEAEHKFNAYLDHETWAESAADFVTFWGENTEKDVSADFAAVKKQMNELLQTSNNPEQFKKKFQQVFGVPYNARAVANYVTTPPQKRDDELRKAAFGNGQAANMLGRVDSYVTSQEVGGKFVKGAVVGAANLTPAGWIGTSITAGVVVAAEADEWTHGRYGDSRNADEYGYGKNLWNDGVTEWYHSEVSTANVTKFAFRSAVGITPSVVKTYSAARAAKTGIEVAAPATNVTARSLAKEAVQVIKPGSGVSAGEFVQDASEFASGQIVRQAKALGQSVTIDETENVLVGGVKSVNRELDGNAAGMVVRDSFVGHVEGKMVDGGVQVGKTIAKGLTRSAANFLSRFRA